MTINRQDVRYTIDGQTGLWEIIIGLEIHAQVISESKLFSGSSASYGGSPMSHVSLVDAAMPGMLPVINLQCVRQAVKTGLGLKAEINFSSSDLSTDKSISLKVKLMNFCSSIVVTFLLEFM